MTEDRQNGPGAVTAEQRADEIARAFDRFAPDSQPAFWRGPVVVTLGLALALTGGAFIGRDLLTRPAAPSTQVMQAPTAAPQPPADAAPRNAAAAEAPVARPPVAARPVRAVAPRPAAPVVADAPAPAAPSAIRPRPRPDRAPVALAAAAMPAKLRPHPRPAAMPATRLATFPASLAATGPVESCPVRLAAGMPRRPAGAASGSALAARMSGLGGSDRDRLIARELLAGNMPDFLRRLTPVTIAGPLPNGRRAEVTICVTPDYLALGSDGDFLRVPMGLPAAARIADRFGFLLPTTRMVDAIYAEAPRRLAPRPMTPGAQMTSTRYFWQHNRTVEGQTGGRAGLLTAGQKKDLVLTNRLRRAPGRVAIYGWHRPNGEPIQPLSTVHGAAYADYSHGVRLVSRTAFVNGRAVPLEDLLADRAYGELISGEGPIDAPVRLLASLYR
ncbi:hypothetical protein SAMN05444722_0188 [Rhodovulum sp. ES.010]|uniref:hypothetical protein n=1 Tax=Rhodovulum sp. ES.010 TaxID=1882821 RepID=UPI00092B733E|nr:hypothetical protein [Rhodovulum sp. ES.010]SIO03552.1 hypothetical protein SAMN05444722_0188 [Rhodovulum sp. ES.010]